MPCRPWNETIAISVELKNSFRTQGRLSEIVDLCKEAKNYADKLNVEVNV